MSKEITLPSGATATLKDPKKLRVKDRKAIIKSSEVEGGDLARAMALSDALVAIMVEAWSLDLPVPSIKIDSLGELEMADYDALVDESKEAQNYLFPTLTDSVENEKNPKAITENSNG
jgi:hypothetical protein